METDIKIKGKQLNKPARGVLRCGPAFFVSVCSFGFIVWIAAGDGRLPGVMGTTIFRGYLLLAVMLTLVHISMLLFLRNVAEQTSTITCRGSMLSGIIAAVLAILFEPLWQPTAPYSTWEAAGMLGLVGVIAGWVATILPYAVSRYWYDYNRWLKNGNRDMNKTLAMGPFRDPKYNMGESRYEYTYGTTYLLRGISVIEVYNNKSHVGYLDPRHYQIQGYETGDLAECRWRIILKNSDTNEWIEVSSRISQAAGDDPGDLAPPLLEGQVNEAVKRVLVLKNDDFTFKQAEGSLPKIARTISPFDKNIIDVVPLYPMLAAVIQPAVMGENKTERPLGIQLELARVPDAAHIVDIVDTSDYSHYYLAVHPADNLEEIVRDIEAKASQLVHQVWDI